MTEDFAPLTLRYHIYEAIEQERSYQDDKYGTTQRRRLSLGDYLTIVRQELNEAARAYVEGETRNARCEILQVAAVAIAAIEAHGLIERQDLNPIPNHQEPITSPHNKRLSDQ